MTQHVTGRLAPSPTGAQHAGNARTYLIAWLSARSQGGRVLLRIEDIDSPRVKAGAADQALEDLRWLGLDWDGDPIVQTQRMPLYKHALEELKAQELVYPCTCTRGDVERAASAPHLEHEGPAYPGICAHRSVADAARLEQSFSWRMRVGARDIGGDFVVWKSFPSRSGRREGTPAYQLAVVVDDAGLGVTEVIRGDDLVPSTPRQLLLYQTLGLGAPGFVHVPLVVGPDGRRLAKRHGDTRLSSMRQAGVRPEAIIGLLAWSCGWQPTSAPITAQALLPHFELRSIPKEPFLLTPDLLAGIGFRVV
ncbi:MAG: tRNA glutamyl-Q(34) synthetase GluQRS [Gemmataceae bacterium]|nr:tRNA glutamyl-Q(34) synthetase GluQRS [Gemmataceae bacterium]MCI0738651.1 tRNA glutamyl-Q(34) synthetase GluQRS [Gemmataceae bacterium]